MESKIENIPENKKYNIDYNSKLFIFENDDLACVLFDDKDKDDDFQIIRSNEKIIYFEKKNIDNDIVTDNNKKYNLYYLKNNIITEVFKNYNIISLKTDNNNDKENINDNIKLTISLTTKTFMEILKKLIETREDNYIKIIENFNNTYFNENQNNDLKKIYQDYDNINSEIKTNDTEIKEITKNIETLKIELQKQKNPTKKPISKATKKPISKELPKEITIETKLNEFEGEKINKEEKQALLKNNLKNKEKIMNEILKNNDIKIIDNDIIKTFDELITPKTTNFESYNIGFNYNKIDNINIDFNKIFSLNYDYSKEKQNFDKIKENFEIFLNIVSKKVLLDPYIFKLASLSINDFNDIFKSYNDIFKSYNKENIVELLYIEITPLYDLYTKKKNDFENKNIEYNNEFHIFILFLIIYFNNIDYKNTENIKYLNVDIFEKKIKQYTDNVKNLLDNDSNKYYIHINDFIGTCNQIILNYKDAWPIKLIFFLFEYCKYVSNIYLKNYKKIFLFFSKKETYNQVISKINDKIKEKSDNSIITFVKITNFEDRKTNIYNQRFKIKLNDYSLIVNYNDHNIPYYDKNSDKFIISDNLPKFLGIVTNDDNKNKLNTIYNNNGGLDSNINKSDKGIENARINYIYDEFDKYENYLREFIKKIVSFEKLKPFEKIINFDKKTQLDRINKQYEKIRINEENKLTETIKVNKTTTTILKLIYKNIYDKFFESNKKNDFNVLMFAFYAYDVYNEFIKIKDNFEKDFQEVKYYKKKIENIYAGKNILENGKINFDIVITNYKKRMPYIKLIIRYIIKMMREKYTYNKLLDSSYGSNYQTYFDISEKNLLKNVWKYDKKYFFGKFTKVFAPSINNKDIAEQMDKIISNVNDNKPVFLIGYGASGAGKTSTLIYNNKSKTPGVLVEICNKLCSEGKQFNEVELIVKEYYITKINITSDEKKCNGIIGNDENSPFKCETDSYTFTVDEKKNIILSPDKVIDIDKPRYPYRIKKLKEISEFSVGTTFGEVMMYLVDSDRFVKATTNNPNSSRSHTLVFVKLKNGNNEGNIIVGDFAGVENVFQCENYETINAFLNQSRDGDDKPYYSGENFGDSDSNNNNEMDLFIHQYNEANKQVNDIKNYLTNNKKIDNYTFKSKMEEFKKLIEDKQKISNLKEIFENKNGKNFIDNWIEIKEILSNHTDTKLLIKVISNKEITKDYNSELDKYIDGLYRYLITKYVKVIKKELVVLGRGIQLLNHVYTNKNIPYFVSNYFDSNEKKTYPRLSMEQGINLDIKEYTTNTKYIQKLLKIIIEKNKTDIITNFNNKKKIDDIHTKQRTNVAEDLFEITYNNIDNSNIIEKIDDYFNIQYNNTYDKKKDNYYNVNFFNLLNINNYMKKNGDLKDEYMQVTREFIEYMDEIYYRYNYGKVICDRRTFEGKFINKSLKDIRDTINQIMNVKNDNNMIKSANFIDICLQQYCKNSLHCFTNNSVSKIPEKKEEIPSLIFSEIFDYLKYNNNKDGIIEFYKNILISVFCVFNISRKANNPPPIPYLDINRLKEIYYQYEQIDNISNRTEFVEELKYIYIKITGDKNKYSSINIPLYKVFKDKIGTLQSTVEFKDLYENNNNEINNLLYNDINKPFNNQEKTKIEKFIELINTSNAASAIGTLEYIDDLSKFNAINNICLDINESRLLDTFDQLYDTKYNEKYNITEKNENIDNVIVSKNVNEDQEEDEDDEEDGPPKYKFDNDDDDGDDETNVVYEIFE